MFIDVHDVFYLIEIISWDFTIHPHRFVELSEKVEGGSGDAANEAYKLFLHESTSLEYQVSPLCERHET